MDATLPIDPSTLSRWLEAARVRRSRRSYLGHPVSGPGADSLEAHCAAFVPFAGARVAMLRNAPQEIFTGWLLRMYGKVASPSALVFVGDARLAGAAARAGYAGEAAVLEATSLGLATCWIGGGVRRDKVAALLGLAAHERVYSISALGYPTDRPTVGERATAGLVGAHKRTPMAKLAPGNESWPPWARAGVELARIAPSATNRQPWRFALQPATAPGPEGALAPDGDGADAGAIHGNREPAVRLSFEGADTPVISKRLDCGIAMLHFELGARAAGAQGSWLLLEGNDVALWVPRSPVDP